MAPRENQDFTCAIGILPDATVHLRSNPSQRGIYRNSLLSYYISSIC